MANMHEEMRSLSLCAADTQSTTLEHLALKARIWLARSIPDEDDDVICLAESICRDVLSMHQHAWRAFGQGWEPNQLREGPEAGERADRQFAQERTALPTAAP
jgi:hypothetical protein